MGTLAEWVGRGRGGEEVCIYNSLSLCVSLSLSLCRIGKMKKARRDKFFN